MKKRTVFFGALATALVLSAVAGSGQAPAAALPAAKAALPGAVENDVLKVQRTPGGPIEELRFGEAIVENKGTEKEKKCLCQAVCFRAAQLAAPAWEDGVFRTHEIRGIRTGWNTPGPYEFFSDRDFGDETGDLGIPEEKIRVEQLDGRPAVSFKELTVRDNWYEFELADGRAVRVGVREDGVFPAEFWSLRSQAKSGGEAGRNAFRQCRRQALARVGALPFRGMSAAWTPTGEKEDVK